MDESDALPVALGRRGHPQDRGGQQPVGGHAPVRGPAARAWDVQLYLKDESVHPTGSLKHRLARSLFLYGLVQRLDRARAPPSSRRPSGSTAVSRGVLRPAARAAVRRGHAAHHHRREDRADRVLRRQLPPRRRPARGLRRGAAGSPPRRGGHYMDQFTYAERATDWRGNNNIAESIFEQLALERHPIPAGSSSGAGTGGTSGHHRPLHPLPAARHRAVRGRPGELRVLRRLADRRRLGFTHRPRLPDRGHRPARVEPSLHPLRHRPHDPGP